MSGSCIGQEERWDDRTYRLLGEEGCERLRSARVLVVGVGGVGGYAAEILIRSGIGHLTIIDADDVSATNINRQLIALRSTVGQSKVELFRSRFIDINPDADVKAIRLYLTPDNVAEILSKEYDYVIDAIDTVAPKVALLAECMCRKIPVISSMGAGGRIDPTKVIYSDLWTTRDDGLARAVRQAFKKRGMRNKLQVVCSSESPKRHSLITLDEENKKSSFGTLASIPALFGIFLANHVIRKIIK